MYLKSMFREKKEKYYKFSTENLHFYSREILLYIVWAFLRNATRFAFFSLGDDASRDVH